MPNPAQPQSPILDRFFGEVGRLAQQHGIAVVFVAARCPQTNLARTAASAGARQNLKNDIAENLGLEEAEPIGWGDRLA